MAYWLFKEEPDHYNFTDLEREGTTLWDGITNNMALMHLRRVRKGDRALYYHTGNEKAVVGEMKVISNPTQTSPLDPRSMAIEVKAVRRLPQPVTLGQIKADPQLADWDLVRLPRLSVMPVTEMQWQRVLELSDG